MPTGIADRPGLEEQAVVGARERHGLGDVETASLEYLTARSPATGVVAAVIPHGHTPIVADQPVPSHELLRWSESLAGIARTGLGFTESVYERERFEEILRIAADIRAAAGGSPASDLVVEEWLALVGHGIAGYVTPKIAVGAVVGNEQGEILLVQRSDSGLWLYPTGWADIGYSASEVAVKEVFEETGIEIEPVRLIAVLDGLRRGFTQVPLYSLVFHCRVLGGTLRPHALECLDVGWFAEDALPAPLAGAAGWTSHAFRAIRGETAEVLFDEPRQPPWRAGTGSQQLPAE